MNSFSTAVVAIVAQNLGAGKKENIVKALWMSLLCSTVLGLPSVGSPFFSISHFLGIFLTPGGFKTDSNTLEEANRDYSSLRNGSGATTPPFGRTHLFPRWLDG
jgi:Na+-driven multidrug efflux pump